MGRIDKERLPNRLLFGELNMETMPRGKEEVEGCSESGFARQLVCMIDGMSCARTGRGGFICV